MNKKLTLLLAIACLSGCAHAPAAKLPLEVHWYRNSAERNAIYEQTYSAALSSAHSLSAGLQPGSWAVILDVDETVLDNSDYEARLANSGQRYSDGTWEVWIKEKQAKSLPGAKRFIDAIKDDLKGQVVLVTNRTDAQCKDTEINLAAQSLRYDQIHCAGVRPDGKTITEKDTRFKQVQDGDPAHQLVPLKVLLYIGDNIQDFPGLSQQGSGDAQRFGATYFVLPNPMYGSWVGNPDQQISN